MTAPSECAGCDEQTRPVRDETSRTSRTTEYGRVDRVDDRCPNCGHIMVENLSGPGARAWAAANAVTVAR